MNKKQNSISPAILISAWVAGLAIIGINIYRIVVKINASNTDDIWQEFALIAVSIFLVVRVIHMHRKQK